ncbi:acetate--CoA ligase family protein [Henriciella aquimarina]|uniref:acetate--CoA ligase family protein n=1 Tax=Henriciella aquimarina TaxID=545261 RepID=UPI000A02C725|nr:acetate--CoA ligase family protein [Henriciella aquimarina]
MTATADTQAMNDTADLRSVRRANLRRLLFPRSIAVVGASKDPSKAGYHALNTLSGFKGELYAINPKESEINGVPCYPDIASLPGVVDLAILAVPAKACPGLVQAAADAGVGGTFIISGGFSETGEAGRQLQDELADICARTGTRLLGPNTSGFINPREHCSASFVHHCEEIGAGRVAVVAQSGGVNISLSFLLGALGEGVSLATGIGNAADVGVSDVLEQLADDPETHAIALHLEGVADGRDLLETLRRITPEKPVCAVVAGRADIGEFAQSHTGNLLGARDRTVAALRQAGVVVVDTLEELAQAAAILSTTRLPAMPDPGIGLITGQAGPGLLIVDGIKTAGLSVPELGPATEEALAQLLPPMTFVKNPVDTGRPGETFSDVVAAVSNDPAIDLLLIWGLVEPAVLDPAEVVKKASVPVVFGSLGMADDVAGQREGLAKQGIKLVTSPARLVLAARILAEDAAHQWRLAKRAPPAIGQPKPPLTANPDEDASKTLLADYGVAVPERRICANHEDALAAFGALGGPVVVKIVAEGVMHKTDVGGVHLGVKTAADMERALVAIDAIPIEVERQYLVEAMAPEGLEIIIGGTNDPSWGPVLLVGMGGVLAEALEDVTVRVGPIDQAEALDMLKGLHMAKLFAGFRGQPEADLETAARTIEALGKFLAEHPEVAEVEINPFRLYPEGGAALDALVVLKPQT